MVDFTISEHYIDRPIGTRSIAVCVVFATLSHRAVDCSWTLFIYFSLTQIFMQSSPQAKYELWMRWWWMRERYIRIGRGEERKRWDIHFFFRLYFIQPSNIVVSRMCSIIIIHNDYVLIIANNFWCLFFFLCPVRFGACFCTSALLCSVSYTVKTNEVYIQWKRYAIWKKKEAELNNSLRAKPNDGNVLNYTKTKRCEWEPIVYPDRFYSFALYLGYIAKYGHRIGWWWCWAHMKFCMCELECS